MEGDDGLGFFFFLLCFSIWIFVVQSSEWRDFHMLLDILAIATALFPLFI